MAKKKLDKLPASDDKYWALADVAQHEVIAPIGCDHRFVGTGKGGQVECRCGAGFILSVGMSVKQDGHIYYKNDTFVI